MYLCPPQLAGPSQPSYAQAYSDIVAAYRRSPSTSVSSIVILVAPDVDALCAARMLAELFKQDDVLHRIIPVSGIAALEAQRDELLNIPELHTLVLVNMGSILELPSQEWFGDFSESLRIHVIDSARPQNLSSLFGGDYGTDRVLVWDDGSVNDLAEVKEAWLALMYEPEPETDEEDTDSDTVADNEEDPRDDNDSDVVEDDDPESSGGKRKRTHTSNPESKRRRTVHTDRPKRTDRQRRIVYTTRIEKHYNGGTWHGQSASGTVYILATVLEREDNDLLWFAILGLTFDYINFRISREKYEHYHRAFHDEVARLNMASEESKTGTVLPTNPDDLRIRATEELRFTLFRHWTLYDAMYHSSYVANKMGIWRERGRRKLSGLLAKMGFSLPQTQQAYSHMDMDLKRQLRNKLDAIAPEYDMIELSYPSFSRSYGFHTTPMSAADMVEALTALLEVGSGDKVEIEIDGARNGGEWFGGLRVWESHKSMQDRSTTISTTENNKPIVWWIRNFWMAYDALDDIQLVNKAVSLAKSLHRAIIRQGSSIIDKQAIKTMNRCRVAVITKGPDLRIFSHPGILSRLALWLVEALRDKGGATTLGRSKKKCLPFIVASLDEEMGTYNVVGVTGALEFGDVRKNQFGLAFLDAKTRCNARTRHGSFDTSVLEINQTDLSVFLETLCHESLG